MFSRWTSLRGSLGWNFVTFCRYRSTLGKYSSKRLASTHPTKVLSPTPVSLITTQRLKSSTAGPEDQVDEPPVKFSTSKGHKMHPSFLHKSGEERWGYAPVRGEAFIVLFSIYAVLIYFCILREENDIDDIMEKGPMWSELAFLDGLGKKELKFCLQEYAKQGLNAEKIISKLAQIEDEERLQKAVTKST